MDAVLAALADPARWRLVGLLAERPRPVGVLAQLAQARQPQTTKHLQALERAGLVASEKVGTRRVYALRSEPLRELAAALDALAGTADAQRAPFEQYALTVAAERLAATRRGWADERAYTFHGSLPVTPEELWPYLTDPRLLTQWWQPDDLRVSECVFEPVPGGRLVLEYRDRDDVAGTDVVVGRAEGEVVDVVPAERLSYTSTPLLPDGRPAFTAYVETALRRTADGTDLDVTYTVDASDVGAADFIAGIELGVDQTLHQLAALIAARTDLRSTS